MTRNADKTVATRTMQPTAVDWFLWGKEDEKNGGSDSAGEDDSDTGDSGSGTGGNPL